MTDTAGNQPLFDLPEEAREAPNLTDLAGCAMLLRPMKTRTVDTSFGPSEVIVADVVAIGPGGALVSLPDTFIFWKGVQEQISGKVATGRWVAGVLRQGAGRNTKAWSLDAPTAGEQERLAGVMASGEFLKIVDGLNEEPF